MQDEWLIEKSTVYLNVKCCVNYFINKIFVYLGNRFFKSGDV